MNSRSILTAITSILLGFVASAETALAQPNIIMIVADDMGYSDAGGVTTGAIAWWPAAIATPGRMETSHVHVVDILPTVLAAAGIAPDSNDPDGNDPDGNDSEGPVAGQSFLSLLKGDSWSRTNPLYFQFMDNRAIRTAEWSLVEVDGAGWELFHTPTDPFENNNLVASKSNVTADLDARWRVWWREQNGEASYQPKSTQDGPHYSPQGDRGSGTAYRPSAMPANLADRYPIR